MNKKIKFGVIGVGYLGKFHVKHLFDLDCVDLIGVHDIDRIQASEFANQYNIKNFKNIEGLLESIDAVSIVTPTKYHYSVAMMALKHNVHIFIEKPITDSVDEANQLLNQATLKKRVIHVGHIERFNPAFKAYVKRSCSPLFVECHRLTKINKRSMDISVVLDLMIHDIDLMLLLINSNIKKIIADGISVISDNIDLANVKLIFENGAVTNLTASRISNKEMRKLRIFEKRKYTTVDLLAKKVKEYEVIPKKGKELVFKNISLNVKNYDALKEELLHFHDSIVSNNLDKNNAKNAIKALEVAKKINHIIKQKLS
ncbi:MAG: oxidoreductase [Flavobacteriales bacterium]|nr:oxidoreductase [Flavobacteriales bacterium]